MYLLKAKKRDIGQTMPISDDTDINSANNKKIKKRKFQSNAQCDDATIQQDWLISFLYKMHAFVKIPMINDYLFN